ncbi:POTRA domain-containing protein [Luteolibacter soli]|uniref:POTRA domain-containing protein n=1 Tax=Luteolibacter soli TaxID=3135280 RepID=A0ABU9AU98_9BACT
MHASARLLLLVIVSLFGLEGCATSPVRAEDIEGVRISKVTLRDVRPGLVSEERLWAQIKTRAGLRYESDKVDEDIKSLYESGLVNDVRVLAEPRRGGLEVIFEVQTRGMIGPGSGFAGNTVFSDQRLAKETGLRANEKIGRSELLTAARRVEAYYHAHGYPETRVSLRSDSDDWIFIIEEGPGPGR